MWAAAAVLLLAAAAWQAQAMPPAGRDLLSRPVQVSNATVDELLAEFLLPCPSHPYLNCKGRDPGGRHLALVDQRGRFLEEVRDDDDDARVVAAKEVVRIPQAGDLLKTADDPGYAFRLLPSEAGDEDFFLVTASGLLVAPAAWGRRAASRDPRLSLLEDRCTGDRDVDAPAAGPTFVQRRDRFQELMNFARCTAGRVSECILTPQGSKAFSTRAEACRSLTWHAEKVGGAFLRFRSALNDDYGLAVGGDGGLTLSGRGEDPELFTGLGTEFVRGVELDRDPQGGGSVPLEGVAADGFGDVRIVFLGRDGRLDEAHVCDHGWNLDDANSLCRGHLGFEAGMPTYDGSFSYGQGQKSRFAVSGLKCRNQNSDFLSCPFRMAKPELTHLEQRSMLKWGGRGYSCRAKDRAGVICGDRAVITSAIKAKAVCPDASSSQQQLEATFQAQAQANKVSSVINSGQHWGDYLLPVPTAVSLVTAVVVQGAHLQQPVRLSRPTTGSSSPASSSLPYDYLRPNLLVFASALARALKKSSQSMRSIEYNSRSIHVYVQKAVANAFSDNRFEHETLLALHLREVQAKAGSSSVKAAEVVAALEETEDIVQELLQAIMATHAEGVVVESDLDRQLGILRRMSERYKRKDQAEVDQAREERKLEVDRSREVFYDAATAALGEECVDGDVPCADCRFRPARRGAACAEGDKVERCVSWEDRCAKPVAECVFLEHLCRQQCHLTELRCRESERSCPDEAPAGRFCPSHGGKPCGPCAYVRDLRHTVDQALAASIDLQQSRESFMAGYASAGEAVGSTVGLAREWLLELESHPNSVQSAAAGRGIASRLRLMETQVAMNRFLSSSLRRGPTRTRLEAWLDGLQGLVGGLKGRGVTTADQVTGAERKGLEKMVEEGENIARVLEEKKKAKLATSAPAAEEEEAAAPAVPVGREAEAQLLNLQEFSRAARERARLGKQMGSALSEVVGRRLRAMGRTETVEMMAGTFQQLTFLKEKWGDLKLFLDKITSTMEQAQRNVREVADYYDVLEVGAASRTSQVDLFRKEIKDKAVEALSYNTYTKRLSKFYTSLIEEGNLISQLENIGKSVAAIRSKLGLERYKERVALGARSAQSKIMAKVREEDGVINQEMKDATRDMRAFVACQVQRATSAGGNDKAKEEEEAAGLVALAGIDAADNEVKNVWRRSDGGSEEGDDDEEEEDDADEEEDDAPVVNGIRLPLEESLLDLKGGKRDADYDDYDDNGVGGGGGEDDRDVFEDGGWTDDDIF